MYDIVYFLKESKTNEELRYSLRSLSNFPHRKVWFVGGCPKGFIPDGHIKEYQNDNKWQNVHKMLKRVCQHKLITEDFWLFNDDFFVMKPIKEPCNYYNGDLYKRIVRLEDAYKRITPYSQLLRDCCKELESLGCETKNYTLHVPMLINKIKMLELLNVTDFPGFRSLYANYYKIGGKEMSDVKVTSLTKVLVGTEYLSTDENSFNGKIGDYIREQFPKPSKYEL